MADYSCIRLDRFPTGIGVSFRTDTIAIHFLNGNGLRKKVCYATWGMLVLSLIVLFNLEESKALIISAVPTLNLEYLSVYISHVIISVMLGLTTLSFLMVIRHLKWQYLLYELVELAAITLLSYHTNLLVSFGLFFGLWHSLRASQVQIDKVNINRPFTIKEFIKESIPFTLISILGIGLMLLITFYLGSEIKTEMLFLIAISMLTLPHMFIYEQFYNYFDPFRLKQKT